jgi:hypothetical protein
MSEISDEIGGFYILVILIVTGLYMLFSYLFVESAQEKALKEICSNQNLTDYKILNAFESHYKIECSGVPIHQTYILQDFCIKFDKWGDCIDTKLKAYELEELGE